MKKKFNDTGLCVPKKHYMVDLSPQLKETVALVEEGEYFIINRPRQFGKTTMLSRLFNFLKDKDDYLPIKISFESIDDVTFDSFKNFAPKFFELFTNNFYIKKIGLVDVFKSQINEKLDSLEGLSQAITDINLKLNKKVVLFIDEVDQASNNRLFIKFLAMLRSKYLQALDDCDATFHSVVLAGLHDVKTLKLKLRPYEEANYNSPWNIAVSYDVDMTFKAKQIETMLVEYVEATGTKMDIARIAEILYYHTSGYPYFVSKLCKIIDEKLKPNEWQEVHILEAIKILLVEKNNANFDTVIKNLVNNKELSNFILQIVVNSKTYSYSLKDPLINFAEMHGIIKEDNGKVAIFNRIYEECITDYFTSIIARERGDVDVVQSQFLKPDGKLDLELLLTKFKETIEEKYSSSEHLKSKEFLEDDLRMKFFMFLKPVLNGIGFSYKEVQISEERRLDVIIIFKNEKFVVELKLWRGEKQHQDGLVQLKDYMKREHVKRGYLIVMNKNQSKKFKITDEAGIFTIWV